jgi:TldD protein
MNTSERFTVAEQTLLDANGVTERDLASTFATIHAHRADDADLYFQLSRAEGWSLEESQVKGGSFSIDQGVGVRTVSGEKTAFAYSDEISASALIAAATTTRSIAQSGGDGSSPSFKKPSVAKTSLYTANDPVLGAGEAQKVALLTELDKITRAIDSRITQVNGRLSLEHEVVMVARADGHMAADVRPLVHLGLSVIVEQNGRREQAHSGMGGRYGFEYFTTERLQSIAQEVVKSALTNLEARPAPAGSMSIVLGPGWPGVLLHEAVGHGLEGDFNRKGSSAFAGRIGERVAAKGVTVIDDGTITDRRGSLNVDDEGNPTSRTVLIEDGILRGYIQDRMNARLMGVPVTGNGRRESYAALPMPRMTNTFMLGGDLHPEEIIKSVKRGIYAPSFSGGEVDITNGKFVFAASEAYYVEDGVIQYPVKGATIIGNGPDALTRVTHIGNDFSLDTGIGVCGKEGQSVPVGVGQPTIRIEGLTVGGTA